MLQVGNLRSYVTDRLTRFTYYLLPDIGPTQDQVYKCHVPKEFPKDSLSNFLHKPAIFRTIEFHKSGNNKERNVKLISSSDGINFTICGFKEYEISESVWRRNTNEAVRTLYSFVMIINPILDNRFETNVTKSLRLKWKTHESLMRQLVNAIMYLNKMPNLRNDEQHPIKCLLVEMCVRGFIENGLDYNYLSEVI